MGCPWQTQGCYPNQIAAGVQVQTASGFDAMLDDYGGEGDPDVLLAAFASRQITSLANGVPVIALINGATHAVIVKGGSYSTAGDGLKQWDYVYVHDPLDGGANRYFVAGQWLAVNFFQIVSDTATIGWDGKLQEFGGSHVLGWTAWPPGPFNQQ
jgi:hypothetical protein